MANARTRNSNPTPGAAKFVFAKEGTQMLLLADNEIDDLSIEVSESTTLDVDVSEIGGSYIWWAKYPAPPTAIKKISYYTPITPPFDDVPITEG